LGRTPNGYCALFDQPGITLRRRSRFELERQDGSAHCEGLKSGIDRTALFMSLDYDEGPAKSSDYGIASHRGPSAPGLARRELGQDEGSAVIEILDEGLLNLEVKYSLSQDDDCSAIRPQGSQMCFGIHPARVPGNDG
jgi:hypothetical protein